jgi:hypothetical protein
VTPCEGIALALSVTTVGGVTLALCDLMTVSKRLERLEDGNEREDAAEKVLHDEGTQLRAELDDLHKAVDFLRRACPRESVTSWDDERDSTREYAGGPPTLKSGQTQVKSNEPPLPSRFDQGEGMDPCGVCGSILPCEHDDE